MSTLTCNRCNRSWEARSPKPPKKCPKCNSPYWNDARVYRLKRLIGEPAEPKEYAAFVYCDQCESLGNSMGCEDCPGNKALNEATS